MMKLVLKNYQTLNIMDIYNEATKEAKQELFSELTQRTNKCTKGIKNTVVEIKERISSILFNLYSVSVAE